MNTGVSIPLLFDPEVDLGHDELALLVKVCVVRVSTLQLQLQGVQLHTHTHTHIYTQTV